jgi:hypothetical protein
MEKCKKCDKEFLPKKGLVNYCSLKCRNSREWSEEDKLKKSKSAKTSNKVLLSNQKNSKTRIQINPEYWVKLKNKRKENRKDEILNLDFKLLAFERLRERIKYEQDCKCNKCGLVEWMGNNIPLELEHKDGNHYNNERDNLEMLCPNCHALTDTWRGRNKNTKRLKISDEKLLEKLLLNNWNMRQSLLDCNLAAKGGNYKRCHKLKREFNNI